MWKWSLTAFLVILNLLTAFFVNVYSSIITEYLKDVLGQDAPNRLLMIIIGLSVLTILCQLIYNRVTDSSPTSSLSVEIKSSPVNVHIQQPLEVLSESQLDTMELSYLEVLRRRILKDVSDTNFDLATSVDLFCQVVKSTPNNVFDISSIVQTTNPGHMIPLPAFQILSNFRQVIIFGAAGAGKTTFLMSLALKVANDSQQEKRRILPVFVRMRNYTDATQRPEDFIKSEIAALMGENDPFVRYIDLYLAQGRCILLLDGLNEMPIYQAEQLVQLDTRLQYIEIFARNSDTKIVITTREEQLPRELPWARAQLLPLQRNQIAEIVRRNFQHTSHIINFLNSLDPRIKDLVRTPFFLSAIMYVIKSIDQETVAKLTRGELLRYLVLCRLRAADKNHAEAVYKSLVRFSMRLSQSLYPNNPISVVQAQELLENGKALRATEDLELAKSAAILTSVTTRSEKFAVVFTHPLYRYTLTAAALADYINEGDIDSAKMLIVEVISSWLQQQERLARTLKITRITLNFEVAEWNEIIPLAIDIGKCESALVQLLSELAKLTFFAFTRRYGINRANQAILGQIMMGATASLAAIGTENAMDALIDIALHADIPPIRWMAVKTLGNVKNSGRISRLIKLISSHDHMLLSLVITGLRRAKDAKNSAIVGLRMLLEHTDKAVSFEAAEALAMLGDASGVNILRDNFTMLLDEQSVETTHGPRLVEPKLRAYFALLRIREHTAVQLTRAFQDSDAPPESVIFGAWAYYYYYFLQETDLQQPESDYQNLIEVVRSLIILEHEGVIEGIKQILEQGKPLTPTANNLSIWSMLRHYIANFQIRIIEAFLAWRDPSSIRILRPLDYMALSKKLRGHLQDRRDYVRAISAYVAGKAHDAESIPTLGVLLGDESAEVRKEAWWAITMIGTPEAADEARHFISKQPLPNPEIYNY